MSTRDEALRLAEEINRYFTSGNAVPVEKAMVRADEWHALYALLRQLSQPVGEVPPLADPDIEEITDDCTFYASAAYSIEYVRERDAMWARALAAAQVPGWIPVTERLPVEGTEVLIYVPAWNSRVVAYVNHDYTPPWIWDVEHLDATCQPSHWAPLLAAPTTTGGNHE